MNFASAQSYLLGLINEHASRRSPNRLDRIRAFVAALGEHAGGLVGVSQQVAQRAVALIEGLGEARDALDRDDACGRAAGLG